MLTLGLSHNESCYQSLLNAYSEPHRFYHTASHINATLIHLDKVKVHIENPSLLELALWFHDAIYRPFSSNNELDSANWCSRFLKDNGVKQETIDHVHQLIMVTMHPSITQSNDEMFMVDIDLSILGSPANIYDDFERNIREEYKKVPYFIYKRKRKALLKSFLNQKQIFQNTFFHEEFEIQARENLDRAIQSL